MDKEITRNVPIPFCHRLSKDHEPLTYTTMTTCCNDQNLLIHITCFEKNPNPAHTFRMSFGEENKKMEISFSSQEAFLPSEQMILTRDGGENLEGVFWGAALTIPLFLLNEYILSDNQLPFSICYERDGVVSSPFSGGKTLLGGICAEKENS